MGVSRHARVAAEHRGPRRSSERRDRRPDHQSHHARHARRSEPRSRQPRLGGSAASRIRSGHDGTGRHHIRSISVSRVLLHVARRRSQPGLLQPGHAPAAMDGAAERSVELANRDGGGSVYRERAPGTPVARDRGATTIRGVRRGPGRRPVSGGRPHHVRRSLARASGIRQRVHSQPRLGATAVFRRYSLGGETERKRRPDAGRRALRRTRSDRRRLQQQRSADCRAGLSPSLHGLLGHGVGCAIGHGARTVEAACQRIT